MKLIDIAIVVIVALPLLLVGGCGRTVNRDRVDALNDASYQYHYRNLDSTRACAQRAVRLADGYADGRAEALNNLAFVDIARMRYADARRKLADVASSTDNQIELLVGNVQLMRLCQRQSDNKNFYHHRQRALVCMRRISEDESLLTPRQRRRLVYAKTEYDIVLSTYLYYVGQRAKSAEALGNIDPNGEIVKDTAQLLAYYYNVGAGGILSAMSYGELQQKEFDYLMRCYLLSRQYHYIFWEANSLQAISEHIQNPADRKRIMADNMQEIGFLNVDEMPDSLLAGNLVQRALALFEAYGDVYQVAGAWRTLSESFRMIGDYTSALICLDNSLKRDTAINAAPDLVASIREQLSIVYSAMDNKPMSDYNRNIYLDLQERTRQDRELEARAEQLDTSLKQLDMMIVAVVLMIVVVVAMLAYFGMRRHRHRGVLAPESLTAPLEEWRKRRREECGERQEHIDELREETFVAGRQLERHRQRNIEQRAKLLLASSVVPLISRLLHEIGQLVRGKEPAGERAARLEYMEQIVDTIDAYNRQLTHWIQLQRGDIQLHIESFPLQGLFDALRRSSMEYRLHGVTLRVEPTSAVVKADSTLTLFMLNTIAENARRYTPSGGTVRVGATEADGYVELYIQDNGCGMSAERLSTLFSHRIVADHGDVARQADGTPAEGGHGYGLINCKGIIEKYRKLSSIFSVCTIGAESEPGRGSRFFFRLPKGVVRAVVALAVALFGAAQHAMAAADADTRLASAFADSTYFCNVRGDYALTISYADSCIVHLNRHYQSATRSAGAKRLMRLSGDYAGRAAELEWFRCGVEADYNVVLAMRNEVAVAALALHRWQLYDYNNSVYTQLFRECSADNTLPSYVRNMQKAEGNRGVAIVLLVILFVLIFPAYYLLYYRHRIYYHLCVGKLNDISRVLLDGRLTPEQQLGEVTRIWADVEADVSRDRRLAALNGIVADLRRDIADDIERMHKLDAEAELRRDELRRTRMDRDRLYVANSVMDNCLSSLKHETMYYPSKLRQLITRGCDDTDTLNAISELADYYKLLYTTLIRQAADTLDRAGNVVSPQDGIGFLLDILKRKNGGERPATSEVATAATGGYCTVSLLMSRLRLDARQTAALFTPLTCDADFLVCSQIVRDIGEYTGARGSGIAACVDENGNVIIKIKIKDGIWKSLKS